MRFGKSDKIQFISTVEGLESIEECLPRPAKHFVPKWFKDIPSAATRSVRFCPSFPDYFSQGYIVPMWTDCVLKYNSETDWSWSTSHFEFTLDSHLNSQMLDYVDASFNGVDGQLIFKTNTPWRIITPPGWSVLQLPLFYHFNKDFSIFPGVVDTDIFSETNQQLLYQGNGKDVKINRGDPFVLYIPFKRSNKLKHEIRYQTEKDRKFFKSQNLKYSGKFPSPTGNGVYKHEQRKRDKELS
jgi:hypothetical protein